MESSPGAKKSSARALVRLFRNRILSIQLVHLVDFGGFTWPGFLLVASRFGAGGVPDAASSAPATARSGDFHTVLPHALQKEIDGTDRGNQQGDGYKRYQHGSGSRILEAATISYVVR
ncbi:MAG: hypothetical protein ABIK82_20565 [Pseudomonadota bacterium]